MRKLDEVQLSVLEFCKHPRTMNQIIYGELLERFKEKGVTWKKLYDTVQKFNEIYYLERNKQGKYFTIVETSQFYRDS